MATYNFHCLICGTPFQATRHDAKTCSTICRVTFNNLKRKDLQEKEIVEQEGDLTPEEIEEVHDKVEKVKDDSVIGRITGNND